MAQCVNHPRKKAEATCASCRDPLCRTCIHRRMRGKVYCAACAYLLQKVGALDAPDDLRLLLAYEAPPPPGEADTSVQPTLAPPTGRKAGISNRLRGAFGAIRAGTPTRRQQQRSGSDRKKDTSEPRFREERRAREHAGGFRLTALSLPLLILVSVAIGYSALKTFRYLEEAAKVQSVPASQVLGKRDFAECCQNIESTMTEVTTGKVPTLACPYSGAAYRIERTAHGIIVSCPNPKAHGFKSISENSRDRTVRVKR